jgi:glycosyltransferase involved in cell wall biosynthesis
MLAQPAGNLLCIFPWLNMGGADKFNLDLLRELGRAGWRTTVVTTQPSAHAWEAAFAPLCEQIVHLAQHPPEAYPAQLLSLLERRKPDVLLLSNSAVGYALLPYLRAHAPELALADYCHSVATSWGDGGFPRLSMQAGALLDLRIVSSESLRNWMAERGAERERIAVCTTNIDASAWIPDSAERAAVRGELGIAPDATVILHAARLDVEKRPELMLRALRHIVTTRPNVTALIAGDGPYADYVQGYLRWYGLERRIRFLGAQPLERMRGLLAASDLFFLPSAYEGISLALYEAMAMQVIPISVDAGGQAELVIPECGVLVPRGSHEFEAYINALVRFIDDPELRERTGRIARERIVSGFRLEEMGHRMDGLLRRTIEAHRRRSAPTVSTDTVLAAAQAAIREAAARVPAQINPTRTWIKGAYRSLVRAGAWWLADLVNRRHTHGM